MTHDPKHGRSIHEAKTPTGEYDQKIVADHSEEAVAAMRAGTLHVTPVAEWQGDGGVYRTFHAKGA